MRFTLIGGLSLLLVASASDAAVYYVDASAGADTNSGTTPSAAWQTLGRAGNITLTPGDSLLLRRGATWGEPLVISNSGTPDAPIRIGAYGSGTSPILDGGRLPAGTPIVTMSQVHDVIVDGLALTNSNHHGLSANGCANIVLTGLTVSSSFHHGILIFDCNRVTVDSVEVSASGLDTSDDFDGIRIDGSGQSELSAFIVRDSSIHDNIGGDGWKSSNGIFIGHTGQPTPVLHGVEITGNDVFRNGNPNQNQAGRGVTGTFHGDVTVTLNRIYRNASAGLYLGDHGIRLDIAILNNFFKDNALRQFGGFTDTTARAEGNTILVDDPTLTAMGAEIGGAGAWALHYNNFSYTTPSNDIYRGFIRINDAAIESTLASDFNIFYSLGPQRWKRSDGVVLNFNQWRQFGYDAHSKNPQ